MKFREFLRNLALIWIPLAIFIIRHVDFGVTSKIKVQGLIPVSIVMLVIYILISKRKARKMQIIYAREIEDDKRTASTKWYYMKRYIVLYFISIVFLSYIQLNFKEVVITLILCGISWFIYIIIDLDLANKYGK